MNGKLNREQIMVQYSADTSTAKSAVLRGAAGVLRLRVLLAVLLVTIVSMAIAPAAWAQCPTGVTPSAPANNATGVATKGQLKWAVTPNVTVDSYNVYFYDGASCSGTPTATATVQGSFNYLDYFDLAPNTTYSWRVEAVKSGCSTVVSSCQSFTTSACHSNGPTLINPPDGATDDHLKVVFAWDPILGNPTGYEVFVQINSTGAFVSQGSTDANTFILTKDIPANAPGVLHQWYVEGKLPGGCTPARSATWSFGTSCPTGAPSLVTPSSGQTMTSPNAITFQWSAVGGADGYDVFYTRNGAAAVKLGETREGTALAGTSLTANLPGTGTYTWYVVALSSGCGNLQSASGNFTVADNCATSGVTLTAPANGATNVASPVTLTWQAQPNAATAGLTGYIVYGRLGNTGEPFRIASVDANTTTTQWAAPTGTHGWFVESTFTSCAPQRSSTFTFTVPAASTCPTTAATLLTPASGATGVSSPVTFTWEAVPGRSYYALQLEGIGTVVTFGTSVTRVMPEGTHNWSVIVHYPSCPSVASEKRSVTVGTAVTCPTTAPTLATPAAGATVTREASDPLVSFAWEPVSGAVNYTLTVTHSNGQTYSVPNLTEPFYNELDLPNGTMTWTVSANYGGSCPGVAATARQLTIASPPPCILNTPAIIQPVNNVEQQSPTVVFSWNAVQNATSYRVYRVRGGNQDPELLGTVNTTSLSKDVDFQELAFDTTNTSNYEWYVEAHGAARCTRSQSARSMIKFKKAQVCNTTAPTLGTSPANNLSTTNKTVQFNWDTVSGAVGYNVWLSLVGGTPSKLNDKSLTPATRSASYDLQVGQYEWWVEALFPGCDSRESLRRNLNITAPCTVAAPSISGPDGTAGPVTSPVTLTWSRVSGATSYDVFAQTATSPMAPVATVTPTAGSTGAISFVYSTQPGGVTWNVRANVPNCGSATSADAQFTVAAPVTCGTPAVPTVNAQRKASSKAVYNLSWNQVPNSLTYEVQESTSSAFTAATTTTVTVTGTQTTFSHDVAIDTTYYYRVRAKSSCNSSIGEYSATSEVNVEAPKNEQQSDTNVGVGSQDAVLRTVFFENPFGSPTPFQAATDEPWIRVSPDQGVMPVAGITFSLIVDPKDLKAGTNAGTLRVTFTGVASTNRESQATTVYTVPVTVNVVTPVKSQGKSEPPSDALIIPAVAAAPGANNSQWVSDIRITNASAEAGRYQVNFTPSGNDASRVSNQTNVDIAAGQSMALDSVLRNWFGARTSESAAGVIEVRSLRTGSTTSARRGRQLLGSSRTYNRSTAGTFGQFIPAIPVSEFVGKGEILTLGEINESASARTNLGLVEGSGNAANVRVTAFDASGTQLATWDQFLRPGEHVQLNQFLRGKGITNDNARVNVEVTSDTGRVMAYASVVDNQTNDPLLVTGDVPTTDTAWIIAGVADLDTGAARWRSDVRIYNPGAAAVNATLVFYPSGTPAQSKSITTTIPARGVRELKDILRNSFTLTGVGGAVHVTTATATPLLVTARTYNLTTTGTYGQYIPGVPKSEGVGSADGIIQIQQLEGSPAFRTNIGLAEVSGKPATVELIATIPGQVVSPRATVSLQANEFKQLLNVFKDTFGLTTEIYNARLAVRVVSGEGKVIAYGSVIDQKTQDPTFVPSEK